MMYLAGRSTCSYQLTINKNMPLIQKLKDPLTAGVGILGATELIALAKVLHDRKKKTW